MRGVRHLLALGTAAVCGVLLYCLRLRFPKALGRLGGDALPWYGAVILLAVAYLLFSILPPTGRLFAEQAGVPAASIPF